MKTKFVLPLLVLVAIGFATCKKKDVLGDVLMTVEYDVDNQAVMMNSLLYQNAAGNRYSVTHLEYYISNFSLKSAEVATFNSQDIVLFNIEQQMSIQLRDVPIGTYNSVSLTIGLDGAHNSSGSLPNTQENLAMAWPDMMGGGYHFMKFEGHYRDSANVQQGFAMHLGKTGHHVNCSFPIDLVVGEDGADLRIKMNLNEWFRNPHVYDFNVDGASIMTNDAALEKIAANGVDVMH